MNYVTYYACFIFINLPRGYFCTMSALYHALCCTYPAMARALNCGLLFSEPISP